MTNVKPRPPAHEDMAQFHLTPAGELIVGGLPLSIVTERVGATPYYAYDRELVHRRVHELRAVLPGEVKLHYAVKANPMPALVQFMAASVDGLDVASSGELKVALDAGVQPAHISFAGPGKTLRELRQAAASGVVINVESAREVELLASVAAECGVRPRVALRVNPDFELKKSGMKMGGGPKQFGIDVEAAPAVLRRVGELGLHFEGFHLFAGSQSLNAEAICDAQRKSYELAVRLAEHAPSTVRSLNLGGGFGIPYFPGEQRLDLAAIGVNLHRIKDRAQRELPEALLAIELGRYLVGEAGIYVTRVIDRKVSRGQVFLIVDGGLHHHLAASGNFGQAVRKNYPVTISPARGRRLETGATEVVSAVGPLCTPLDVLAEGMALPVAAEGDFLVVFQSGAYGASASPQAFLGHPPCTEVLL